MKNIDEMLKELTLDEKISLLEGYKSWNTKEIKRLSIPSIYLTDGPLGLRKKKEEMDGDGAMGLGDSYPSTAFISPANIANSFDKNLAYKIGEAIGKECVYYDVDLLLAPGMNIKRNPRCGRNFEYYSEDPYVSGYMASNFVNGLKSQNVGATLKHYALNNSENYRYNSDSICDVRALREVYLKGYEIAIKNSDVDALMCGYNIVNDYQCSENNFLNNVVLRDTFKFKGVVMTDWGATKDRVEGVKCGIDLDMPGNIKENSISLKEAVLNKTLDESVLDLRVKNILELVKKHKDIKIEKENIEQLLKKHYDLAVKCAEESAVLLKNDNNILPLNNNEKYLVVGDLFKKMRYQGAGSSLIKPKYLTHPIDAFNKNNVNYKFVRGYKEVDDKVDKKLEKEAINEAKNFETIIFFGGLTDLKESEGFDRPNLNISYNQVSLINKLVSLNKKVILVLFGGSSFIIPYIDKVNAILNMYVPGEGGGEACYNLLFGKTNPSGRLAETWVKDEKYIPFNSVFGKTQQELYKESIFVGYKYYDFNKDKVLYPFGYGLSYSKFEYSSLNIKENKEYINVSFKVKNISNIKGKEVSQIYIKNNENSKVFKTKKYLVDFVKTELDSNEEKEINININKDDFKYFNKDRNDFVLESGKYSILICRNAFSVMLKEDIDIVGEDIKSPYSDNINNKYKDLNNFDIDNSSYEELLGRKIKPITKDKKITLETSLVDYKKTLMGKIVLKIVEDQTIKSAFPKKYNSLKKINKIKDESLRNTLYKNYFFVVNLTPHNSVRSLVQSSGGFVNMNTANGIVELANGHIIKGIKYLKAKN